MKHFNGLLFTVGRAVVATYYDNRSKAHLVPIEREDGTEIPIPSRESVEKMQDRLDVKLLEKSIRLLNDNERQMLIMRHLEGYRVKEIAKLLGTTENTVSVTINRAINKLREYYGRS